MLCLCPSLFAPILTYLCSPVVLPITSVSEMWGMNTLLVLACTIWPHAKLAKGAFVSIPVLCNCQWGYFQASVAFYRTYWTSSTAIHKSCELESRWSRWKEEARERQATVWCSATGPFKLFHFMNIHRIKLPSLFWEPEGLGVWRLPSLSRKRLEVLELL